MKGGHNRKPRELKVLHGTFRADRNPGNEPDPEKVVDIPKYPTGMNKHARKLWKNLCTELIDLGVLTVVDLPAMEICCVNYGLYKDAHEAVYSEKVKDPETGKLKKIKRSLAEYMKGRNSQTIPEYTAMTKAFETFKSYITEFGLTPASRNRLNLPEKPEEDGMEKLDNEAL